MSRSGRFKRLLNDGYDGRDLWSWSMFDFANSGYTTVVITAVFNAYFVSTVSNNADWATFLWTVILSISYLFAMVTGPSIGVFIDQSGLRKKVLFLSTVGCTVATIGLGSINEGDIWLASILIIVSNYFFCIGENIIGSYLPDIAKKEGVGRVSGIGWGVGYIGGIVTLAISLFVVIKLQTSGWAPSDYVPVTMIITGAIFFVAALPTFFFLRERPYAITTESRERDTGYPWSIMLSGAESFRDLRRFLWSTVFFQAGVQAVIAVAAIYAQQVMQFTFSQTIVLIMVVNITASLGSWIFGRVHDLLGHRRSLSFILSAWVFVTVFAWLSESVVSFWVVANLAGIFLGACQSNTRAFVAVLAPASRRAEIFGLWGLSVKCASILGPMVYGALTWILAGRHQDAILSLGVMFLVGLLLLIGVNESRGIAAANEASTKDR